MIAYASIHDEITKQCVVGFGSNHEAYERMGMTKMDVERGNDGAWYLKGYAPQQSAEERQEELYRQYQAIIQNKLDSEAIKLGYDNADRVVARQNSTNPKYRAEGVAFNIWYDELWGFGNDLLNKVIAGEAEIPTPEDFEAMLPELNIVYPAD